MTLAQLPPRARASEGTDTAVSWLRKRFAP
jgi:hypothetical protein